MAVQKGLDGDYTNNTAHAVVYIRIVAREALDAILFVCMDAQYFIKQSTREAQQSFGHTQIEPCFTIRKVSSVAMSVTPDDPGSTTTTFVRQRKVAGRQPTE